MRAFTERQAPFLSEVGFGSVNILDGGCKLRLGDIVWPSKVQDSRHFMLARRSIRPQSLLTIEEWEDKGPPGVAETAAIKAATTSRDAIYTFSLHDYE